MGSLHAAALLQAGVSRGSAGGDHHADAFFAKDAFGCALCRVGLDGGGAKVAPQGPDDKVLTEGDEGRGEGMPLGQGQGQEGEEGELDGFC